MRVTRRLHPDFLRGLRGREGRGRGDDQMLTMTRSRANWERFTSMLEDFESTNTNQVGHRGPSTLTGREHLDNEINMITLDSSIEEVIEEEEISVRPPPATSGERVA